jgi:hypothetical protein
VKTQTGSVQVTVVPAPASAAAASGGGAMDLLTVLALLCVSARRVRFLFLALRHLLRDIEPFFLRASIVRRRNASLL